MAEYTNKTQLDELFSRYGLNPEHYCKPFNQVFPSFAMDKEILSTIDIVHCSECIHARSDDDLYLCDRLNYWFNDDWFCADGERKDDNNRY